MENVECQVKEYVICFIFSRLTKVWKMSKYGVCEVYFLDEIKMAKSKQVNEK